MNARYVRISTGNQNIERQLARKFKGEVLFLDIISGAIPFSERKGGGEVLSKIADGTISYLSVSSIDRLGRNLFDILSTIELLNQNGTVLKVDNLGLESLVNGKPNSAFKLIISVMANIAEMERETMLERQREGIALAKAKGIYRGREKGTFESDEVFLAKYTDVIKNLRKGNSVRDTAKICCVSTGTVQKVRNLLKLNSL